jgi:integrase
MTEKWMTVAPGVRARTHATRRHGARRDRYFTLRFSVDGRQLEEALGWASEGWTVERALETLGELRKARRTGEGAITLGARAQARRDADQRAAAEKAEQERREKTMAYLWERYRTEVIAIKNKPRTATEKTRLWRTRIEPATGLTRINDVTEEDAGSIVRAPLRLDDKGAITGGKAEAGNIYRLLHHLFAQGLKWRLRNRELGNPLESVDEPKVPRRERLLTAKEVGALLRALDSAAAIEKPQIVAAIRTVIYTGARVSELLSLRREYIRRDEMELHFGYEERVFSTADLRGDTGGH